MKSAIIYPNETIELCLYIDRDQHILSQNIKTLPII
jgi:hypothetical protein